MGIVNGISIINNLLAGTLSGAQLQTYLGTGANLASFVQAINSRSQARAMTESNTAMTAVTASSTAMTAVAASSTAMTAVAASTTAKMAIFNSDTALASIAASSTALTAMRASSQYQLSAGTAGAIAGLNAAGSYIVVGLSTSNGSSAGVNVLTRRSGSTVSMFQAATGTTASNGLTFPAAMPMVTPFSVSNTGAGWTWFVGTVRCDV
jgi:hypothetical protein